MFALVAQVLERATSSSKVHTVRSSLGPPSLRTACQPAHKASAAQQVVVRTSVLRATCQPAPEGRLQRSKSVRAVRRPSRRLSARPARRLRVGIIRTRQVVAGTGASLGGTAHALSRSPCGPSVHLIAVVVVRFLVVACVVQCDLGALRRSWSRAASSSSYFGMPLKPTPVALRT